MCNKNNYLLGHVRALCPGCRHAPHSRNRLAGGSFVAVGVVVEEVGVTVGLVVVVVRRGVDEGVGLGGGGDGDGEREGDELSGGAAGRGHVMSFKFSGQNSRILLNKYHCRWLERPNGVRTGGSWSAFGDHDFIFKIERFTSVDPALSFTKM